MRATAPIRAVGLLFILIAGLALPARSAKYKMAVLAWNLELGEGVSFKETIEKGSNGEIEAIAQNDRWTDSHESEGSPVPLQTVIDGGAQMGHTYLDVMGAVDHRFWVFESPNLIRGYRHMEGIIEGPIGTELLKSLSDKGLVGLCFAYNGGAAGVATKDRAIRGPEDLRGMKVGVYTEGVAAAWLRSLGATPVIVSHGKEPRDGSLDGVVVTWRNFRNSNLDRAFKYWSMPDSSYLLRVTYVNKKFYDSLPQAYQTLLTDKLREIARVERAKAVGLNEEAKRMMLATGLREIHLTDSGKKAFQEALRPAYRDAIAPLVGSDLIERIRKQADGSIHYQLPADFVAR